MGQRGSRSKSGGLFSGEAEVGPPGQPHNPCDFRGWGPQAPCTAHLNLAAQQAEAGAPGEAGD